MTPDELLPNVGVNHARGVVQVDLCKPERILAAVLKQRILVNINSPTQSMQAMVARVNMNGLPGAGAQAS